MLTIYAKIEFALNELSGESGPFLPHDAETTSYLDPGTNMNPIAALRENEQLLEVRNICPVLGATTP